MTNGEAPTEVVFLPGFDGVAEIKAVKDGIELISARGRRGRCAIDLRWLNREG